MAELLTSLNWWAGIGGGVLYFIIGALWYGPLFGKTWMVEMEMDEHPEPPRAVIYIYSLVLQIVVGIALELFGILIGVESAVQGLYLGLGTAACFVLTTKGVNGIYNDVSLRLYFIDGGYHLVGFAAAGFVTGIW